MDIIKKIVAKNPQFKGEKQSSEWLKFKGTGAHFVKLLKGEYTDQHINYRTKQKEKGIVLFLQENGKAYKYFMNMFGKDGKYSYLFVKFADIPEGTNLIMEYKQKPGSYEGFIDVKMNNQNNEQAEIPIIEEDGQGGYNTEEESEDYGDNQETDEGNIQL